MNLFRPSTWKRCSDAQYLERLRHQVEQSDRYRKWSLLFYGTLTLVSFGLLVAMGWLAEKLTQWQPGANVPWTLCLMGLAFLAGVKFAWLFLAALHGLLDAIGNYRAERLLLKYHDSLEAVLAADQPAGEFAPSADPTHSSADP